MEIISYNNELSFANILFSRIFRNIVIERKNEQNKVKRIPVKCIIGNRSRVFKAAENPKQNTAYTLPIIVITRTGLTRNPSRLSNLHNEIKYQTTGGQINYNLVTPVPIDINYTVTIISKFPGDNDMIIGNFIPFFNSDLFVSSVHPKFKNVTYNSQIIMDDSISETAPEEISSDSQNLITTTCTFTFKTFLFGGTDSAYAGIYSSASSSTGDTGSGEDTEETIYNGFIPALTGISLDMHAVPYLNPYYKFKPTSVEGNYLSAEYDDVPWIIRDVVSEKTKEKLLYNPELSGSLSGMTVISEMDEKILKYADLTNEHYKIDQYFTDVDAGILEPTMDRLRWKINENGVFEIDREYYN